MIGVDKTIDVNPSMPAVGLYKMENMTCNITDLITSAPMASLGFTNLAFQLHTSAPYPPFKAFSGYGSPTYVSPSTSYSELRFSYSRNNGALFNLVPTASTYGTYAFAVGSPGVSFSSETEHS